MTDGAADQAFDATKDAVQSTLEAAKSAEEAVLDKVDDAQDAIGEVTPVPTEFKSKTSPSDIKKRLDWGEPALTLIDVRDRAEFNAERIMGAIPMRMEDFVGNEQNNMSLERDIYLYGDDAPSAAQKMYDAGFKKVSVIQGGLAAWKAIGGAVEGQGQAPGLLEGGANLVGQTATP
ncbi:MAG: rhodanese-like domain-containing protein [Cyanobacteria bacterium J06581_3]